MADLGPLCLPLGVHSGDAEQSIDALAAALESSQSARELVADRFPDIFNRVAGSDELEVAVDGGERLFVIGADLSAVGAGSLAVFLKPSKRYLELVAALGAHLKIDVVTVHRWPVLSVAGRTATVAEGGRGGNASPAGGQS